MGLIQIGGSIVAGPPQGASPCRDRSVLNVALALKGGGGSKPFQVSTSALSMNLNTGGSYVTLPGVGAGSTVTQADTLYLFSSSPILVRLTFSSSPDIVSVLPVDGFFMQEVDATHYLKLVETNGSGTIEYFASGQQ